MLPTSFLQPLRISSHRTSCHDQDQSPDRAGAPQRADDPPCQIRSASRRKQLLVLGPRFPDLQQAMRQWFRPGLASTAFATVRKCEQSEHFLIEHSCLSVAAVDTWSLTWACRDQAFLELPRYPSIAKWPSGFRHMLAKPIATSSNYTSWLEAPPPIQAAG